MSNNEKLNPDNAPADKNIDSTRSENRQGSNDKANASNSTSRMEGTGAEDGGPHTENPGHTGSHQEGQIPKQGDPNKVGQLGKPGDKPE